jgi:hypothetical protein
MASGSAALLILDRQHVELADKVARGERRGALSLLGNVRSILLFEKINLGIAPNKSHGAKNFFEIRARTGQHIIIGKDS